MDLEGLKKQIFDIVKLYFVGAEVVWAEQNTAAKPSLPFVMLRFGTVSNQGRVHKDTANGEPQHSYNRRAVLAINLFTVGDVQATGKGQRPAKINTAMNDLQAFSDYLESDHVAAITEGLNITISPISPIRDITALINDSSFEYRALAEFSVDFVQTVNAAAGIPSGPGWKPTPSGGGSAELAAKETGYFERVAIEEEST